MNDLLKEAIADAKAVRETALANAKVALEEAFTPKLQSMLSAKLSEEDGMLDDDMDDTIPEDMHNPDAAPSTSTEGDDLMAEPKDMPMEGEHEPKVDEMDYKDKVEETDEEPDPNPTMDEGDYEKQEEDLELEAIIRELEEDLGEDLDSSDIGSGTGVSDDASSTHTEDPGEGDLTEGEHDDDKKMKSETEDKKDTVEEDISLDEIIAALKEEEDKKDKVEEEDEKKDKVEEEEDKKDLKEAYNVIKFLKSKINEVNLLNAKLLFSNKLFRNYPLSENQKMKVIENFDRASNLREVKLIYSTLCESFIGSKTKRSIRESYASKPSMSTAPKKEIISESNALTARWKKLANLK
jgi:hypothetical protein